MFYLNSIHQITFLLKIILCTLQIYKCDLPREKGSNAAKPNFTREPSERSLKSYTSGRIGRSWKLHPPLTTTNSTLSCLWNLHVRAHMDTIKHEVWVSGVAGFSLLTESSDTYGFNRTLQWFFGNNESSKIFLKNTIR